jgi:hypothetical protein
MTDLEYASLRDRLRATSEKWLAPLGLKWWSVNLDYDRDGEDARALEVPAGFESAARTQCQWAYMHATIIFNMPALLAKTEAQLEQIFVHECMHLFLHETRAGTRCACDWDIRHEERVATTLQKAFMWTYEMAFEAGQKTGTAQKPLSLDAVPGQAAYEIAADQGLLGGKE